MLVGVMSGKVKVHSVSFKKRRVYYKVNTIKLWRGYERGIDLLS